MGQIRVLPPGLVNRIAAGECIERPASVVKELVENALDAGASRVEITLLDGGREQIQVTDDAGGMDADDLRLCVQAHATSKLASDDDLFNIHTMGFRGEALASIGAVARLQVTSRRRESEVGHTVRVEGGVPGAVVPCASPPGTTVAVRDLFYCVPARRKFLRTNQTEMSHVTEQLARIALAHPGVSFTLKHQGRSVHELAATPDRRQRIADFYGPELAEALLPFRRTDSGITVDGFAAPPAHCRRSGKWEYIFLNGRHIRDRFISHAIKSAYRSLIMPDELPVIFLYLSLDPAQVDVNVHPTKVEVRWRDSNFLHAQVLAALREKFLTTNLDRTLRPSTADQQEYRERVREAMVDFFTHAQPNCTVAPSGSSPVPEHAFARTRQSETIVERSAAPPGGTGFPTPVLAATPAAPAEAAPTWPSAPVRGAGRVGATAAIQLHNSYIVAETTEGLEIIDQHALHERILYEELRRRLTDRPLESQQLLIPEIVRVPPDRLAALEIHGPLLARLGLTLSAVGPQSVAISAVPALLQRVEPREFVSHLLDLLSEQGAHPDPEMLLHSILDMMACKSAVKAGDVLTSEELAALLARRDEAERSSHCPHGRPTTLRMSLRDLERQFRRR